MNLYEGIKTYIPVNEQEARDKEIMLKHLASGEDCVTREVRIALLVKTWSPTLQHLFGRSTKSVQRP